MLRHNVTLSGRPSFHFFKIAQTPSLAQATAGIVAKGIRQSQRSADVSPPLPNHKPKRFESATAQGVTENSTIRFGSKSKAGGTPALRPTISPRDRAGHLHAILKSRVKGHSRLCG